MCANAAFLVHANTEDSSKECGSKTKVACDSVDVKVWPPLLLWPVFFVHFSSLVVIGFHWLFRIPKKPVSGVQCL